MRRKVIFLSVITLALIGGIVFFGAGFGQEPKAAQTDEIKMPEVVILGKDAKLGQVTFNHAKHNGGTYNIVKDQKIACISCHHTAQPNSEVIKHPPLQTSWPSDRTTTLTQELFDKDPKAAGVAACRECHAREGLIPKLLPAIPQIKHESSPAMITMTNMTAFHRACTGCHTEVRKTNPLSKGPIQVQCLSCHKKDAAPPKA